MRAFSLTTALEERQDPEVMDKQRRQLRTRLQEHLSEDELLHLTRTSRSIGIAENTLRKLLRDDWTQVGRSTIELVCDRFDISPSQLFEFVPDRFWESFIERRRCLLIRTPAQSGKTGDSYDPYDVTARAKLSDFLKSVVHRDIKTDPVDLSTDAEILKAVRSENCFIAGSPRTNRATEVVLSRLFEIPPRTATASERERLPFRFVFAREKEVQSSLAEPWRKGRGAKSGVGLCNQDGASMFIEVDWRPFKEYMKGTYSRGRDCAMVAIINRPFGTDRNVKTIVVSGLSGVGTEAAASAVIRDFRDLEPVEETGAAFGVIEALYSKITPNTNARKSIGFNWKHLQGTRRPIPGAS